MMPQEFSEFVTVDLAPLDLELIQVEGDGWSASNPRPSRSRFLATRGVERPVTSRFDILHPAREGWLTVNLPFIERKTLYMADIGAKDGWLDLATKTTTVNPEVLRLCEQVIRKLRKRLKFSVMSFSLSTHESSLYRPIGHSEGARDWLRNAGEWRQEGVENIGFKLP
jgi:hypothetical protein